MNRIAPGIAALLPALALLCPLSVRADAVPPPPLRLPPAGNAISGPERETLRQDLGTVQGLFDALPKKKENANAEIFLKAVRLALEFDEFYKPDEVKKARELLAEARSRIDALRRGQQPWLKQTGFTVRGYYSQIDGSAQPFGLEIPADAPASAAPAWVWLHGRGDDTTDLKFIHSRMRSKGQFNPPGTIIIHPWGRYCTGYKSAGEQDVLDVPALLVREGKIDPRRIALAGFSMGGAGAWLAGAHYRDRWAVVHTGAGFVDVKRYTGAKEENLPPWEVTLWGLNDVPCYARNLLNGPLISYSGEQDKQRASAEVMTEVLKAEGHELRHLIGPGMGHKYHPETAREVQALVQEAVLHPAEVPLTLHYQTRTLRYARLHWLQAAALEAHWQDSRIDATLDQPPARATTATVTTRGITALRLVCQEKEQWRGDLKITIDGQTLTGGGAGKAILLTRENGQWRIGRGEPAGLRKKPGLQGPIDDAFTAPFLVVLPDRPCADPALDAWVQRESAFFLRRWRGLMRGDCRVKKAAAVTADDIRLYHLILWGDAASNPLIARALPALPVKWSAGNVQLGARSWTEKTAVPVLTYPSPLNPEKYVVLNSGLTFRPAHDSTNSQQNPKLPDWAVIDISDQSAPAERAGKVLDAGFFGEKWEIKDTK